MVVVVITVSVILTQFKIIGNIKIKKKIGLDKLLVVVVITVGKVVQLKQFKYTFVVLEKEKK